MKTTPRERLLLAILPTVLLSGVYFGLIRPSAERRIESAHARVDPTLGAPASRASRESAEGVSRAQRELDAAMRRDADAAKRSADMRERWSHAAGRAATVRELSTLFGERNARVERSSRTDDANSGSLVAAGLRALERTMVEIGGEPPELWRFDLRCGFRALLDALGDLAHVHGFALPVSLTLEPSSGPDDLAVSLWVWI